MTQPGQVETLAQALIDDLTAVVEQITAELDALAQQWFTTTVAQRTARLTALREDLLALVDQADTIAAARVLSTVQGSYEIGAWTAAIISGTSAAFTSVDVDAITHIAQDTMTDLLRATTGVREDIKAMIRELARDQVRAKVTVGKTATQAGRDLAAALRERGLTAVVYANGRSVPLVTYAAMVVRTKTAEAYQEGGFNQGDRLGVQWWEVMDGPDCGWTSHEDPAKANGMIVDLDTARERPTSHPNCRRSTSPRPDIVDPDHAAPLAPEAVEAVWDAAVRAYQASTVPASMSAVGARTSVGLDLGAGTIPVTAATRKFAATLRRHSA